jgi:hypothetical protein
MKSAAAYFIKRAFGALDLNAVFRPLTSGSWLMICLAFAVSGFTASGLLAF